MGPLRSGWVLRPASLEGWAGVPGPIEVGDRRENLLSPSPVGEEGVHGDGGAAEVGHDDGGGEVDGDGQGVGLHCGTGSFLGPQHGCQEEMAHRKMKGRRQEGDPQNRG